MRTFWLFLTLQTAILEWRRGFKPEVRAWFAFRHFFVMPSGFVFCRILCGHWNVDTSDHLIHKIESAACATESELFPHQQKPRKKEISNHKYLLNSETAEGVSHSSRFHSTRLMQAKMVTMAIRMVPAQFSENYLDGAVTTWRMANKENFKGQKLLFFFFF